MVVLYAPIALSERIPRKRDCRIPSRRPGSRSMTRISCRMPAWSRSWPWRPGPGCRTWPQSTSARPRTAGRTRTSKPAAWSRGWQPGRTRSTTWACCGAVRRARWSPGSGPHPRSDRSCARSPGETSGRQRSPAGSSWPACSGGRVPARPMITSVLMCASCSRPRQLRRASRRWCQEARSFSY
jgi:hypothetical protein